MDIKKTISDNIFHDYDSEEVFCRNSVDYHAMTGEHTEILGQFLDYAGMNVEQLKERLVSGYLSMDRSKFCKWIFLFYRRKYENNLN